MLLDILFFFKDNKKIRIPTMPCQNSHRVKLERGVLCTFLYYVSVPRAGLEPARLAALVFETNASTYSAIWAKAFAKLRLLFHITTSL